MSRAMTVLTLTAAVSAIAGCGGGGDTSTVTTTAPAERLSKPEYIKQADAICQRSREDTADLQRRYEDLASKDITAENTGEAADVLREVAAAGTNVADELRQLSPPPGDSQVINDYLSTAESTVSLVNSLADAYDSLDPDRIRALAREIGTNTVKARGIAQGYGFKVCGSG